MASKSVLNFRKGEVEEAVHIQDLRNIMYEYAKSSTVDDVLDRALHYLIILSGKRIQPAHVLISFQPPFHDYMQINYTEKSCKVCKGVKGCFSIVYPETDYKETACSVATAVTKVEQFMPLHTINLISLYYGREVGRLYSKDRHGVIENALDTRRFVLPVNHPPLPKDF